MATARTWAGTETPGPARKATAACGLPCTRAASASANGATTCSPATLPSTMKPDPPPAAEPEADAPPPEVVAPLLAGWGAVDPGARAVRPPPLATLSPTAPLRVITVPSVGAVKVGP